MIEQKRFSGIMDLDSGEADVLPPNHLYALNGRFFGDRNGLRFQNVPGNVVISNSNLPTGSNECIGSFFDSVKQRIIWFNYNSNGRNGIYKYDIRTGLITKIFLCFTDSATDILGFNLNYPIHSVVLVYRPDSDGDLLYWTDSSNRPSYINLDTVAALAPFTANMLYAAKMPPLTPPTVGYASDATKNYNNVHNRYFRFAYRWVYKNLEKSTFSPTSILALPDAIVAPQIDTASNVNNYITVAVLSGSTEDFDSIEIMAQEFNGTTWDSFKLINTVDRDDIGTPIPFLYTFAFYNDGIYSTIPTQESDLPFDYLPDVSNTLELLNGNTIIYGGITEGYDLIPRSDIDVQITCALATGSAPADVPAWLFGQNERFGLVYFDARGKTNGVVSFLADATIDTTNFNVTTQQYVSNTPANFYQVPKISASINHLPPSWAVTYQWVRLDLSPPFFLEYVTNDYQTDNDFIYLSTQALIANNDKGFVPSYEFKSGDRVKVIAKFNATNDTTAYSTQLDFQILDVVDRTMNASTFNPASTGKFLKLSKPASFPTPAYSAQMLVRIYTPPVNVTDTTAIFYEWGQKYAIVGGFHMGQLQNQTNSQPATFAWFNGYVYQKQRNFPGIVTNTNMGALMVMDRNYNDFQNSKANSNSRGWPIDVNARQEYFPVTVRWGGQYVQDTNINNLNRFYPQDLDTIDRAKGDIQRFKARDRILRVFQKRGCGRYGIYARYIQNNEGVPELVTTDEIITTNNISYYQGEYGVGDQPCGLVSGKNQDYFVDPVRGYQVRLSEDGLTPISELYKGQFYIRNLLTPYNKTYLRADGSKAKVLGFYDYFEEQYNCILQAGTLNGNAIPAYTFSFNEKRNGYCSFYDFKPEWATCAEDIVYTWVAGQLWVHNNSTYNNFYGTQYPIQLKVVFNGNLLEKKTWQAISENASDIWHCSAIYTNVNSYAGQRQESELIDADFQVLESMPSASFLRDSHSIGGIVNGDIVKGNWLVATFEITTPSNLVFLDELTIKFSDSPLTAK